MACRPCEQKAAALKRAQEAAKKVKTSSSQASPAGARVKASQVKISR